jgi:energy-coupling factor transport system ATP-binding protein
MIEIRRLTYSYPRAERPALEDVSLSVAAGEFVLLAGPSGAGKSTLLRCLNGLAPHFSGGAIQGSVEVDGQNALDVGPQGLSRTVGFVFQDPEAQTVLDEVESEVAFGLENSAVPAEEMRERVRETLRVLGLEEQRHRSPWTLSGGERQKVAIASVLAGRPKILVLDEPTSQLDPAAARDLLETVARLNSELGLTVILVEHRLERVVRYAERMVYLEAGRVTLDGPIRQMLGKVETRQRPPLARLAEQLAWQEMPLSVDEGRQMAGDDISYRQNGAGRITKQEEQAGPGRAPVLLARQLYHGYNDREVLRGVDLEIRPGEAVALLGPNGAGKSTFLKCLVGLLRPQSGEVLLEGHSTAGKSVAEICRQVAYLPQTPDDLLFADSVGEELQITLANHGLVNDAADRLVEDLLSELGLADRQADYPRDLSVGQRQRVALGAVAVMRPKLLMLDEPTRGLDYATKDNLMALWRRWLNDGMALLLVTHDVEMATRVAQRVVVLDEGRITADGPVEEVLSRLEAFEPQMARLFPGRRWLTVAEVMAAVE